MENKKRVISKKATRKFFDGRKPIKVIRNKTGTFWNANDGKETYSRDIIKLLDHLNIDYTLKEINNG